jgi:integrase
MPVYFDKQKNRWRFTFNRIVAGRRRRASRLLPQAWGRARAETYDRLETGRLYAVATGVEPQARLIDEAVRLYLEHRIPQHRAGHKATLHLAALLPWYEGRDLAELPAIARTYATDNAGKLAAGTIHNRLAYLRAACRYAWREHGIGENDPTARMRVPPANNERQVYLRPAELARLVRACRDPDVRAIMRIAYYTGLRWISELLPLERRDLVRHGRQLWLNVAHTKNTTPRMVPVHPAIRRDLRRLPFRRHWRDYYHAFELARERVGMKHVRMHDLRHSLASAIISSGGTLPDVQAALHHKSVVSARRYAHLYPERLQKVIRSIGKRRR